MNPNLLWLVWIAAFVVLETMGLLGIGGMKPATYWLRLGIPQFGALMLAAIAWFTAHLYLEPHWRKRKDDE